MLGLKEIMARDAVGNDVAAFNVLKRKLQEVESENREFFDAAIKTRNDAVAPAVMAELRRPSGMPFRKDTSLHSFKQALEHRAKQEDAGGNAERELDEDYARMADKLAQKLQQSHVPLTNDEKKLLAAVNQIGSTLEAQEDSRVQSSAHRRAEEQLGKMLAQASAESAQMVASRHEVAAAETEASLMVENAQQRRLESMRVNEEARNVLSRAGLALKRLGRAEWSEIKAMKAPSPILIQMIGAVRILLGDAGLPPVEEMEPGAPLPSDWPACIRMLNHTRFISRLLKLTRGTLAVPDVAWTIIRRNLGPELSRDDDLLDEDGNTVGTPDDAASEMSGGSTTGKTAHTEGVLRRWMAALLRSRTVSATMDLARADLAEAAGQLQAASATLRQKSNEARIVQKRMHTLNSRISGLIAASEAVPHRAALQRLHEYQRLRGELQETEVLHDTLKSEQRRLTGDSDEGSDEDEREETDDEEVDGRGVTAATEGGGRLIKAHRRRRGSYSAVAADAVKALDAIQETHRQQAAQLRQRLERLDARDREQKSRVTPAALAAAAANDMETLSRLVHEQEAYAKEVSKGGPGLRRLTVEEQWTVLGPRCCDKDGRTPLHYAACHGCYEAAMYLLTAGANPRVQDHGTGFTALHYAVAHRQTQIIVLLNQFDSTLINVTDHLGQTALHLATQAQQQAADDQSEQDLDPKAAQVVSLLLRLGADANAMDSSGVTPLGLTGSLSGDYADSVR